EREHPLETDSRNVEAPLSRARGEDEMSVRNRPALAELDSPRGAVDPRCSNAESQVDALFAEMRFGPERQAVDVHLPLEKRLRQRGALIGGVLLRGEKNDPAVKPLLAQGHRGLDPGVAGAGDDDRGHRLGFKAASAVTDLIHWRRAGSCDASPRGSRGPDRQGPSTRDR